MPLPNFLNKLRSKLLMPPRDISDAYRTPGFNDDYYGTDTGAPGTSAVVAPDLGGTASGTLRTDASGTLASGPSTRELPGFDPSAIDQAERPRPSIREQREAYQGRAGRGVGDILKSVGTGAIAGLASGRGLSGALGGAIAGGAVGAISPRTAAGARFDQFKRPQLEADEAERQRRMGLLRQLETDDLNRRTKEATIAKTGAETSNINSQVQTRQAEAARNAAAFPLEMQTKQAQYQKVFSDIETGAVNRREGEARIKKIESDIQRSTELAPLQKQKLLSEIQENRAQAGAASRSNRDKPAAQTSTQKSYQRDLDSQVLRYRQLDEQVFGQGRSADEATRVKAKADQDAVRNNIRGGLKTTLRTKYPDASDSELNDFVEDWLKKNGLGG
jgi:hypothetical protein